MVLLNYIYGIVMINIVPVYLFLSFDLKMTFPLNGHESWNFDVQTWSLFKEDTWLIVAEVKF